MNGRVCATLRAVVCVLLGRRTARSPHGLARQRPRGERDEAEAERHQPRLLARGAPLEQELAQERLRRSNAEQIAEERQARIEDLQMAMRLLEAPKPTGESQGGSGGSNTWSTDLGHEPHTADHDLGQTESPQVRPSSPEPPTRTTDLGHGGPSEPPPRPTPRQGWWARLTGR